MLIDRMVNLLSRGCVVPVVCYIKQCWQRGDTDVSLIRYFVTEVKYIILTTIYITINSYNQCFYILGLGSNSSSILN